MGPNKSERDAKPSVERRQSGDRRTREVSHGGVDRREGERRQPK